MAEADDHLVYLRGRFRGDAEDAALWAQVDVDRREYWRGFAVANLIAANMCRLALERIGNNSDAPIAAALGQDEGPPALTD